MSEEQVIANSDHSSTNAYVVVLESTGAIAAGMVADAAGSVATGIALATGVTVSTPVVATAATAS